MGSDYHTTRPSVPLLHNVRNCCIKQTIYSRMNWSLPQLSFCALWRCREHWIQDGTTGVNESALGACVPSARRYFVKASIRWHRQRALRHRHRNGISVAVEFCPGHQPDLAQHGIYIAGQELNCVVATFLQRSSPCPIGVFSQLGSDPSCIFQVRASSVGRLT